MTDTTTEPREPENPAAWALAQHIADHPVSTIQAAFRYLNAPLAIEVREEPAVVLPAPADRSAVLLWAADALDESETLRDLTDDHMGDVHAAANELRRLAAEEQPATEAQPPRHRWYVETRDGIANEWAPGIRLLNRDHAVERYHVLNTNHPKWKDGTPVERRLVRETTTYTVESTA